MGALGILRTSWGSTSEAFTELRERNLPLGDKEAFLSRDGRSGVPASRNHSPLHRRLPQEASRPLLASLSGELGGLMRKISGQEVSEHTGSVR